MRRDRSSKRWAIILIGVLQAIVFAGPILLSTDVFSYIAYARMGVEHGINPYLNGPVAIAHDPIYRYVGQDWKHVATAYGPLYTLLSYPLAPARPEGRALGDEARGAARERRHARVDMALRARPGAEPRGRDSHRRRQSAVCHLWAGRRPQRPDHAAADDGRGELHVRRQGRLGGSLGGGGGAGEGHCRGAASVHGPQQAPSGDDSRMPWLRWLSARWPAMPRSACTGSMSSPR